MRLEKQEITRKVYNSNNISIAVATAFERTGTEIKDLVKIQEIAEDLKSEFPNMREELMIKVLRNGGFGKYGVPFKLSVCQISVWIREELKEQKTYKI